jgi:glycerol kinase
VSGRDDVLVVDVGTSSVRASVVAPDGTVSATQQVPAPPRTPEPGTVELDATEVAAAVLATARAVVSDVGAVAAVGVTNQRATTVVWDADSGEPVGPGIGWQDLRTVLDCLILRDQGLRVGPSESATKLRWLVERAPADARGGERLRFGTVDSWVVHVLTEGAVHVTDTTNACVTGLVSPETGGWDATALDVLGLEASLLPRIVDTVGVVGAATALAGAPPIAAIVGDQQGSLAGQGCVAPGQAKLTFGTGGMLDQVLADRPTFGTRGRGGCYPIVARSRDGVRTWGLEAIVLTAGACVDWLRDDLGLVDSPEQASALAASVADTAGVAFVPALLGVGTPDWDFGARGGFFGLTRGATKAHLCRAVLEGIAQRGRDLVEAAEADGEPLGALRVDGGLSDSAPFCQLLADVTGRPVEVAPVREATTRGAGLLAGLAVGLVADEAAIAATWAPRRTVEPLLDDDARASRRAAWSAAKTQALRTIPSLSSVTFV